MFYRFRRFCLALAPSLEKRMSKNDKFDKFVVLDKFEKFLLR
ncbi:hypothetical protein BN1221_00233c [Brenneria goodwinii]|uniref:Uncharacterized protein n=1 Tax=Brenneria goodwinii TaxID=1109412 RepID=A0A0G4JPH2_9GAMM|nr:hypothetical protein BN1221_00233c [Brenneria goodwinii]